MAAPSKPITQALRESFSRWATWNKVHRRNHIWLDMIWTFLFNTMVATVFTVALLLFSSQKIDIKVHFAYQMLYANCIGFSIQGLFYLLGRYLVPNLNFDKVSVGFRIAYFTAIPFAGVLIGLAIAEGVQGRSISRYFSAYPGILIGIALMSILISLIGWNISTQRMRRLHAEQQASQAQLQMLQAQIEPHFLFNTLANVVSLVEYEPATAKRMLESFIVYLRATLDNSRKTQATLDDELRLIESYLQLLQIRMDTRLSYAIEVSPELRSAPFAPMLLQPLVENAIKHGLEPKVEGGHVCVKAWRDASGMHINVTDNGLGLRGGQALRAGSVGLDNIRHRLSNQYGANATLSIIDVAQSTTDQTGVRSQIDISQLALDQYAQEQTLSRNEL